MEENRKKIIKNFKKFRKFVNDKFNDNIIFSKVIEELNNIDFDNFNFCGTWRISKDTGNIGGYIISTMENNDSSGITIKACEDLLKLFNYYYL